MSLRVKKYRLFCSKAGCGYHKILPLYSTNDHYLLSDNGQISATYFRIDGWCNSCNDFTNIFHPKNINKISSEIHDIENRYNRSGFLGFFKERSPEDIELWELNKKILDVLRRRTDKTSKCCVCQGVDFRVLELNNLQHSKVIHPKCGGHLEVEEGTLFIGSNLVYIRSSFKHKDKEIEQEFNKSTSVRAKLLGPNDEFIRMK